MGSVPGSGRSPGGGHGNPLWYSCTENPIDSRAWSSYYQDGFYEAMAEIGISEEQRKERNIVFHSLRHFCATILSQRTDMKTVQAILGHRSEKMSIHYSDHDTEEKLSNIKNIMQNAWKNYQIA